MGIFESGMRWRGGQRGISQYFNDLGGCSPVSCQYRRKNYPEPRNVLKIKRVTPIGGHSLLIYSKIQQSAHSKKDKSAGAIPKTGDSRRHLVRVFREGSHRSSHYFTPTWRLTAFSRCPNFAASKISKKCAKTVTSLADASSGSDCS